MGVAIKADSPKTDLMRLKSRVVGGGLADAFLQARGRLNRGVNIKVVNKLGNLNREK